MAIVLTIIVNPMQLCVQRNVPEKSKKKITEAMLVGMYVTEA